MPQYHTLGQIPHKRHTQFRKPNGELYSEELFSTHGFSNVYSLIYHVYPPTIVKEDLTPAATKSRGYFAASRITIKDSKGNNVDPKDWKPENAGNYRYIQSSGYDNSLGLVKFNFHNRFSVYLHDTNHRDFFDKQKRSLSSGCVRVENPLKLAEYLLDDATNYNFEKITKILQSEKTKNIKIKKNVQIHILYWTAWSENNKLIFRDDFYNLDAVLYQKL